MLPSEGWDCTSEKPEPLLVARAATLRKPTCKTANAWLLDRGPSCRDIFEVVQLTCVPLILQLHPELLMQIPVCSWLVTFADHDGKGRRQSFEDGLQPRESGWKRQPQAPRCTPAAALLHPKHHAAGQLQASCSSWGVERVVQCENCRQGLMQRTQQCAQSDAPPQEHARSAGG